MKKFLAVVLAAVSPLFAQDAPDVNIEKILRDLDEIAKKQEQTLTSAKQSAFSKIQAAASSDTAAISFYEEATRATQFAGQAQEMQKWLEWKNNNAETLRSSDMRKAVQMHLQYLLLSLKRFDAGDEGGKDFLKPSLEYAKLLRQFLYDLDDSGRRNTQMQQQSGDRSGRTGGRNFTATGNAIRDAQNMVRQNIGGSMFARYLGLEPYLPQQKDWEGSSGSFRGILEKNVMSIYRTDKNPEIMKMWDSIIAYEEERANPKNALDFNVTNWKGVQLPQLHFARANDYIAIGYRNRGIMEIFALIKQHPTHPDFANWISRLREILKPKPAEPEKTETPETPAPAEETPAQ